MFGQTELAAAVSANDAYVDAGGDMVAMLAELGIDVGGASDVAYQRGLRGLAAIRGGDPVVWGAIAAAGGLTGEQKDVLMITAAAFVDGLAAHARASTP